MMNKLKWYRLSLPIVTGLALLACMIAPQAIFGETRPYLNSSHLAQKHAPEQPNKQAETVAKQEFWIVTNEIKSAAKNGIPEMEVYRWDPGFLVVNKGDTVTLHFYGVKGQAHPFEIRGLGVKGDVQKGKVTTVTFTPTRVGTYPIVCLVHPTKEQHGPMIGYLKVE